MIQINDTYFGCELHDIIIKLQTELHMNGSRYLAKIKDGPTHIQITCPYHSDGMERKPSAGIRKTDGLLHCFACGEVHSLTEVISHCFEKDDGGIYGMQWLLKNFSVTAKEYNRNVKFKVGRGVDSDSNTNDVQNVQFVTEEELEKYRYTHPYMYKRGLTDEVIELFDIGYDRDMQAITFPVRDIHGNCLFIARRSVKTKFFNYPEGVEKPLYGLYELSRLEKFPDEVYICESMLDALTIWCYNKYAVALNGLGNELSIAQIKKLPCRKVILATDKDDAGKKARIRLRKEINNKIVTQLDYRTYPDHAKDMNDMTREEFYALGEVF